MPTRRQLLAAPLPPVLPLAMPHLPRAADWPTEQPIEVFVPFPAGGGVDTMVRGILAHVAPRLPGARFAVSNRPGAAGQLGFEATCNAAPDGYTLGAATNTAMNAISIGRTPRCRTAEFTCIAKVVDAPGGFRVHPDNPWRTLADLAAAAKRHPEALGADGQDADLPRAGVRLRGRQRLRHRRPARPPGADPRQAGSGVPRGAGGPGLHRRGRPAEPATAAAALAGEDRAAMMAADLAALRTLWQRRPWKE